MPPAEILNLRDAILMSAQWLERRGIDSARLDAEVLLGHVLGKKRVDLYVDWAQPLDESEKARYRELLRRRAEHEPVAYITGKREFYSLDFEVGPDVLVPRPETEILIDAALRKMPEDRREGIEEPPETADRMPAGARPSHSAPHRIADIGTGSGNIAVTLAFHLPDARIVATDVSPAALQVAHRNAVRHGVIDRIEFVRSSLLEAVDGEPFDLIASNPPYVAERDRETLAPDVLEYEPSTALFAGPDGLECLRVLVPAATERLRPGGRLLIEIGAGQVDDVLGMIADAGCFRDAAAYRDYQGHDRVVSAWRED